MGKKSLILGGAMLVALVGNFYLAVLVLQEEECKIGREENKKIVEELEGEEKKWEEQIKIYKETEVIRDEIMELMVNHEKAMIKYCEGDTDKITFDFEREIFFAKSEALIKKKIELESELEF